MSLIGKVVIITCASSGTGEATARLLASKGVKLVLASRCAVKLRALVADITDNDGDAVYAVCDVTKKEDNLNLVKLAKEKYGKVDVIFFSDGQIPNFPLSQLMTVDWKRMLDLNLLSVLNGLEAVLPEFIAQKSGYIIATSSVPELKLYPGSALYCASKWAVCALLEALRLESSREGTNINTAMIYPATIEPEPEERQKVRYSPKCCNSQYEASAIGAESIANIVAFVLDQGENTSLSEPTVDPTPTTLESEKKRGFNDQAKSNCGKGCSWSICAGVRSI